VDFLGPSIHPFFRYLTTHLPTPNGYSQITLNYEKFLLNGQGDVLRRYPRKYAPFDMETDLQTILETPTTTTLPTPPPKYDKAWREAKKEAVKSEYAFRFNYNYYNAPESMYRYNPVNDRPTTAATTIQESTEK
jgi:hypothetical protein